MRRGIKALIQRAMAGILAMMLVSPGFASERLSLTTGPNFPPFTDETMPESGFFTYLVSELYKQNSQDIDVTFHPWRRGYNQVLAGQFVATFPYIHTDQRAEDFYYSDPVLDIVGKAFIRKEDRQKFLVEKDFHQASICIILGSALRANVQKWVDDNRMLVHRPADFNGCLEALIRKRTDLIPINGYSFAWLTQQNGVSRDDFLPIALDMPTAHYHVIFAKSNPNGKAMVEQFNDILKQARQTGQFSKSIKQYEKKIGVSLVYEKPDT